MTVQRWPVAQERRDAAIDAPRQETSCASCRRWSNLSPSVQVKYSKEKQRCAD
jgi:hypothetical protein